MPELLKNLGASVLLSPMELTRLINSSPHRYKTYLIRKRNPGEYRTIAQPAKEVKTLQYWVIKHVLNRFPVHSAATGYRRGLNIADNALRHVHGRFLLKLDFENFFPSLRAVDFRLFMRKHAPQFSPIEVEALSRILFWNPKHTNDLCLSIGAPSSPLVSNMLLRDFDNQVATFCSSLGVSYTRYADDISFSAKVSDLLRRVELQVHRICENLESPRLALNRRKTVRVSKKTSRRVTGLVLTNDAKVSLGRDYKRSIRASVHHFITNQLAASECAKLRGVLAYVNSVEPEYLKRLQEHYGRDVIQRILTVA
jgi:hypothetical protein